MEQKNWAVVRTLVRYRRYDTAAELLLLNKICVLQSHLTNYFLPQQKLISKIRDSAKITKRYDPRPPRTGARPRARRSESRQGDHERDVGGADPAAIQRQIQALAQQQLTLTTSKASAGRKPPKVRTPQPVNISGETRYAATDTAAPRFRRPRGPAWRGTWRDRARRA